MIKKKFLNIKPIRQDYKKLIGLPNQDFNLIQQKIYTNNKLKLYSKTFQFNFGFNYQKP